MGTHDILKKELALPIYSNMSDAERLTSLKLKNISKDISIDVLRVQEYLNLMDKLIDLEDSISSAARKAVRTFDIHESIDMSNPIINSKFKQVLKSLVDDVSVSIDSVDEAYILSLGTKFISRADQLNLPTLKIGYIMEART